VWICRIWVVSCASVRSRSLGPVASHLHAQGGVLLAESFQLDVISWTPILFATSAMVRAGIEGKAFRAQPSDDGDRAIGS
jgi:hypothetical protein